MSIPHPSTAKFPSLQRGAALIVGMILLMVLTLLAIAGMNTASLEFLMAGNQQFHNRAFEASETGLDVAFANSNVNPNIPTEPFANNMPNGNDRYVANVRPLSSPAGTLFQIPGFTNDKFTAYTFEIQSVGTSARNSSADHTQELYVVANAPTGSPPVLPPAGGGGNPPPLQ